MGRNRLRDVFNRIIWTNARDEYEVVIVSRGEPGNVKVIPLRGLIRASRDGVIISLGGSESFIPYHRVLLVRGINGVVVYEKGKGH
ncbi:MAG: RNA repair domain-containing protein [Caldivirga sp.]